MLVMISWLITIIGRTIMSKWPSVGDKFSLDQGLKGRLAKR
jgi:hypothetical protein